ncbi:MAG: peptide chain release factor 1 [Candidatus Thorarchaeota archaeon]|nr:peptide chain release factor 1 [Candidatus Thorarchaeota archaeon]
MTLTKHQLKKKISELKAYQGRHSSFTTLYIPPDKNLVDIMSFIRTEIAGAENIKDKINRKNVQENLTAILNELTKISRLPENGMVFFYGIEDQGGTPSVIREIVVPPAPISQFVYICGREFVTDELERMTEPRSMIVIVLLEGGKVTIGYLRGKRVELVRDEDYFIIGKTRAGGQSARRYERIREEKLLEFFRHVGRLLSELLLDKLDSVDAIVLGGNTIRAQEFLEKGELDYRIRQKIADTIIPVGIIDETGLFQAVKEASRIMKETEVYQERVEWESFMQDLMRGLNTVTYGANEVMEALKAGRVQTLLIVEGSPLFDELADEAPKYGSDIIVFSNQTESGAQLKGFGGIAARLRW